MNTININFNEKLEKILRFIVEIDKVKQIFRKTKLFDAGRFENDSEHSWTVCIMALLLKEYADYSVDIAKVVVMLLIHDIVEIDAGDTFLYSEKRNDVHADEEKAAERIFGLLDDDKRDYFLNTWREFEERKTNEAKFAAVFDRFEPLLQNYLTEGYTWKNNNIKYDMVLEKNKHIREASAEIWELIKVMLDDAVEKGYLDK